MSRTFDLILLNICFVISCIPLLTIGAAMTAMYSVTLKMADGEWGYVVKHYTDSFLKNLKQATLLWLILVFIGGFFAADVYVLYFVLPEQYLLLQIVIWVLVFFCISAIIYVFPM
ncbi:MAG: YesL family protein, partial [Lachnospiraceae bacterium]|nr:YesL family protein [Lachnospiraceae bacterium]